MSNDANGSSPKRSDSLSRLADALISNYRIPKGVDSSDELTNDESKDLENRARREELDRMGEVHGLRKTYLWVAFFFVIAVCIASFSIVTLCGTGDMSLATSVLVTLLSTTMANVLGVLYIAFNWLFPKAEGSH